MAKKTTKTGAKRSQKEDLIVKKLNKTLHDSERSISEITFKPKESAQKLNDVLAKSGFKNMQVDRLKLGLKKKVCTKYKAVYDKDGNIIEYRCVKWA